MNHLNKKNERKHQIKGLLYTVVLIGLLVTMLTFSGRVDGLKDSLLEWIDPQKEIATPADAAPVAGIYWHRGGNG